MSHGIARRGQIEKAGAFVLVLVAIALYWFGINWLVQRVYPTRAHDDTERLMAYRVIVYGCHAIVAVTHGPSSETLHMSVIGSCLPMRRLWS